MQLASGAFFELFHGAHENSLAGICFKRVGEYLYGGSTSAFRIRSEIPVLGVVARTAHSASIARGNRAASRRHLPDSAGAWTVSHPAAAIDGRAPRDRSGRVHRVQLAGHGAGTAVRWTHH